MGRRLFWEPAAFLEECSVTEQDIITPDLIEDAEYVKSAWRVASQSRLEGIFETGRRLIEIQKKYRDDRGKWSQLIGDNQWAGNSLLPFQKSHTKRLVRIAGCARLRPHAGVLPDDSTTLGKLVSLTDERFQELIDGGTINPNMGRKDMDAPKIHKKAWVPVVPALNASAGNRLAALAHMTVEELVDRGLSVEGSGAQTKGGVKAAAMEVQTNPQTYEMMKSIILVSRCNHLSRMDRDNIAKAIEAINEHKSIRPVYERVEPIVKHMWGERRGTLGRDADAERRHKEFNRVIRLIANTCVSAPKIDIPYLHEEQVAEANNSLAEAIKGLQDLKSLITELHE